MLWIRQAAYFMVSMPNITHVFFVCSATKGFHCKIKMKWVKQHFFCCYFYTINYSFRFSCNNTSLLGFFFSPAELYMLHLFHWLRFSFFFSSSARCIFYVYYKLYTHFFCTISEENRANKNSANKNTNCKNLILHIYRNTHITRFVFLLKVFSSLQLSVHLEGKILSHQILSLMRIVCNYSQAIQYYFQYIFLDAYG